MNNIPKEILDFAGSVELGEVSDKIGNEQGLMIDQIGELDAQIRHVLRGFSKSADFTKDIMHYLEIDAARAEKITAAVNAEVFQKLKDHVQKNIESYGSEQNTSSIEKAGGFSVDRNEAFVATADESKIENKAHLIDGIEHPVSGAEKISRKEIPSFPQKQQTPHVEPLIDHLLKGSVAQPQQKVTVASVPTNPSTGSVPTPPPPPPKTGPDQYREPTN